MSPVHQYKTFEKKVASQVRQGARGVAAGFSGFFRRVWRTGRQNFTIMLIPHSEKRIINFKISVFALGFLGLLLVGILGVFFWFSTDFARLNRTLSDKTETLSSAQANLEAMREGVSQLRRASHLFEERLNSTFATAGIPAPKAKVDPNAQGDLAGLFNLQLFDKGTPREVEELKALTSYLEDATPPLDQVNSVWASQKSLLVDIPTLWPLRGIRGTVTNPFGPAINPFSGLWYLHRGIDIGVPYGTPIVATANGTVTRVDSDPANYGNFVVVKHNYGFSTLYGHMSRVAASQGESITRGQVIGFVGTTGMSTGPHLHYEVQIGTQAVDPTKYLSISSDILTQGSP